MDCKRLKRLRSHYVFTFMLLAVQWRTVFPGPIRSSYDDDIKRATSIIKLLDSEIIELLDRYRDFHGSFAVTVKNDAPDSTITGNNISEKLNNIYMKNILFHQNIVRVEQYQGDLWGNPTSVAGPLSRVKNRLNTFLVMMKKTLLDSGEEIPLTSTPAPLQLSHEHDYAKKAYGWGAIVTLKHWLAQVLQVLKDSKTPV